MASGASDVFEVEIMDLIFLNATFDNIGDAGGISGSTAAGSAEITLHTATLSDTSDQTTSECAYTGYAAQTVARSGTGWTNSAGTVTNDSEILFGEKTAGGDETATDVGIGSAVAAIEELWFWGALDASLSITNGVNPRFAASALSIACT